MHSSPEQFHSALENPDMRSAIGLVISDDDARALLSNPAWEQDYFERWSQLTPVIVAAEAEDSPDGDNADVPEATAAAPVRERRRVRPPRKKAGLKEKSAAPPNGGRRLGKGLTVLLTFVLVIAAFAAGGATVMTLTGTNIEDILNPSATAVAPAVAPLTVAERDAPIAGGRTCGDANLGVIVTLQDGGSLVCSPVGNSTRWAPKPRS